MYNGIGLQTARGTGTNGYVQANLSNLLLSRRRVEYNSEADLRRAEAEINRAPNEDILQHQRKRVIEMKCVEFEMLMEEKGFDDDEILKKVSDYRNLLLSQLESGELNLDSELDSRDSHARAKAAVQNRDRMKNALGLDKDFVPGTSMKTMKKSDVVGAALAAPVQKAEESLLNTLKNEIKEKSGKDKKRKKRRQESTSSSSSDSDSSDSSDDSSEDTSSDDSDSSSSDESVKHKKTKNRKMDKKERHDRHDKKDRRDEDDRTTRRRKDDGKREERVEKRRRSRTPDDNRRKKARGSHDEERRRKRRSSSSNRREESSRKRDRSHERSPQRKVKEEPPSPPNEEESHHKEQTRQSESRGNKESRRDSYSDECSDSDSNDSLKYKIRSTHIMAFSDEQELIDQIRHDLRMEDDSGMCTRVVLPERRRAKYGGLPLNFRSATSSDDEDEPSNSGYCDFEIPLVEESALTSEIIDGRLRSRTIESADVCGQQIVNEDKSSGELFVAHDVADVKNIRGKQSAIGEQPSKSILVLYTDAKDSDGNVPSIKISVQPTAKVGQVIGYCLYRFFTNFGVALGDSVEDFQLLMADDGGEVELDLPPLDKGRAIGDLGFTVLAMVSRKTKRDEESNSMHRVVVYLPTGQQFVFELEHLDHSLEWLRDETLNRKNMEMEGTIEPLGLMPEMEYDLEDINVFGKPLNLQQSIANTGCSEFILIRKYSSRGDFHPRGMSRQRSTALLSPLSRSSNNAAFDFTTAGVSFNETPCIPSGGTSPVFFVEDDEVIMSFRVTRLHKVKKNWPAKMSIRFDRFDIVPVTNNRKSFLPNTYQKPISVPWNYLCDVKTVERDSESSSVLSFTWLPREDVAAFIRPTLEEQISLRDIAQYYEDRTWKVVLVEFESPEKASQAKSHMTEVIGALNSSVYQAYQHSSNGSRCPSEAAESVLMQMADGLLPSSSSTRSRKSATIRKLTRLGRTLRTWKD
ncbi:hypothetical protein RB195_020048 [Necator americanus]|uniref:CWF21 domain-containing protein n=1 Tax=Necator americanus TaxID=51031 RepID=A0ABR1CIF6_NECAM